MPFSISCWWNAEKPWKWRDRACQTHKWIFSTKHSLSSFREIIVLRIFWEYKFREDWQIHKAIHRDQAQKVSYHCKRWGNALFYQAIKIRCPSSRRSALKLLQNLHCLSSVWQAPGGKHIQAQNWNAGMPIELFHNPVDIICNKPCIIRQGNRLLFIKDIDGTQASPLSYKRICGDSKEFGSQILFRICAEHDK